MGGKIARNDAVDELARDEGEERVAISEIKCMSAAYKVEVARDKKDLEVQLSRRHFPDHDLCHRCAGCDWEELRKLRCYVAQILKAESERR
jgi:hypothetical protein